MVKCIYALTLLLFLNACNKEENIKSTVDSAAPTPFTALSGLMTVAAYTETNLDLTPYIIGDKSQLEITDIVSKDTERCVASTTNSLMVNVTLNSPSWCDYKYTVSNDQGQQDTAKISIVSSETEKPLLSTISIPVVLGSSDVTINLKAELGDRIHGYNLSDEFVVQTDKGSAMGVATKSDAQSINYQLPDTFGWNYIAYTLTNGEDVLIGYVFISISDEINQPPIITNPTFVYPKKLARQETIEVDLETIALISFDKKVSHQYNHDNIDYIPNTTPLICAMECIKNKICLGFDFDRRNGCVLKAKVHVQMPNDNTGDSYKISPRLQKHELLTIFDDSGIWGLSSIQSAETTVALLTPDINNKKFTVTAAKNGKYDVAYVISDNKGGSTVGVIQFEVGLVEKPAYCHQFPDVLGADNLNCLPYIHANNSVYTATPSQEYMNSIGYDGYSALNEGEEDFYGNKGIYVLMGVVESIDWCTHLNKNAYLGETNWRLLDLYEMEDFYGSRYYKSEDRSTLFFTTDGWPTMFDYITADIDGSNPSGKNLGDGHLSNNIHANYTSCISDSIISRH